VRRDPNTAIRLGEAALSVWLGQNLTKPSPGRWQD
jgi:hypothetical protein